MRFRRLVQTIGIGDLGVFGCCMARFKRDSRKGRGVDKSMRSHHRNSLSSLSDAVRTARQWPEVGAFLLSGDIFF